MSTEASFHVPSRDDVPLTASCDRSLALPVIGIERKWVVDEVPREVMALSHSKIVKGFLHVGSVDGEMQIRKESAVSKVNSCAHSLSLRRGVGTARSDITIDISEIQFHTLWPATEGARLEKIRLRVPHGDHAIELDVFCGALAGLCVAEIGFSSARNAQSFQAPRWFGREVTEDSSYTDRALACQMGAPRRQDRITLTSC